MANIEKKGRERARNKDEAVGKEVKDRWPWSESQCAQGALRNCPGSRLSAPRCCLQARKI